MPKECLLEQSLIDEQKTSAMEVQNPRSQVISIERMAILAAIAAGLKRCRHITTRAGMLTGRAGKADPKVHHMSIYTLQFRHRQIASYGLAVRFLIEWAIG